MTMGISRIVAVAAAVVAAQAFAGDYRAPRLPDGAPDLQGVWTNATATPVERSPELGERRAFSEQEAAAISKAALAAVAAAMMLGARRLRGKTSYADAFFPLMFLHLGHWDNIVWSWQMQFVLATALTCVLLLVIVVYGRGDLSTGPSVVAGVALMALPLAGATSLVFGPPLALWVALAGARCFRGAPARLCAPHKSAP